ncbi:MAG: DUF885 domain-containing protein [Thermoanaerobaculia bacterium]
MRPNGMSSRRLIVAALALAAVAACTGGDRRADEEEGADVAGRAESQAQELGSLVDRFLEASFEADPLFAVDQGRHEYDGRFPDWSPAGIGRRVGRLEGFRAEALALADGDLSEAERFDRDYLVAVIDGQLFWLRDAEWWRRNPTFYNFSPSVYLTRDYAPLAERMRAYTTWAENVPATLAQARENLETPLPRTYVDIGKLAMGGLVEFLRGDVPGVFAAVEDVQAQQAFAEANAKAAAAFAETLAWFSEQEAAATEDFRLGPEMFRQMLAATERVDTPLAELLAVGERDLERNLAALAAACTGIAPGAAVVDCIARVQADKPEGSVVAAAQEQLATLKRFLIQHDSVSIPGTEEARVAEAPPFNRWNFAYIEIPGPFEQKPLPSTYYIAPPDPSWPEEEQQAYLPGRSDLLFTSVHEVWPGHFLQFLHAQRADSKLARSFVGYAFAEGWAHYTEELMWELGLGGGDPATHVGQLLNALLRNVRYLCAIGYHAGEMSVEECEAMFREKAFQDPGNARQQAARGTFDPAYLNYTMGKLMIRKLREDWTAAHGGRASWKLFHDRFLSFGGPPVPLVRRAMVGDAGTPL